MMVRLAREDLVAAKELFEQDHAGELVGQREGPERKAMIDPVLQPEPVGPADDEADVAPALATGLEPASERLGVHRLPAGIEQADKGIAGQPARHRLLVDHLDDLDAGLARQEALEMLGVVGEGRAYAPHGQDGPLHRCDSTGMADEQQPPERHINIHFSPDEMAGHYANFANVSFSDYEFTITFARVDHEVEDEEIPGVVVSRINLSSRFARELMDALDDAWSKYRTREGIKNLPEYGDDQDR